MSHSDAGTLSSVMLVPHQLESWPERINLFERIFILRKDHPSCWVSSSVNESCHATQIYMHRCIPLRLSLDDRTWATHRCSCVCLIMIALERIWTFLCFLLGSMFSNISLPLDSSSRSQDLSTTICTIHSNHPTYLCHQLISLSEGDYKSNLGEILSRLKTWSFQSRTIQSHHPPIMPE
jgi:hypothetical protein